MALGAVLLGAGCATSSPHRAAVTPSTATAPTTPTSGPTTSTTAAVPTPVTTPTPSVKTTVAATTVPATTATTVPPPAITATVTGTQGQPVSGAVIIDGTTLAVFHADSQGRVTVPYCAPLAQFWVADWVIPLGTSSPTSHGKPGSAGGSTTYFGPPPTTPGPGYARLDRIWPQGDASPAPCPGQAVDVQLPAGGTVDITWVRQTGTATPSPVSGPVAGVYEILPGLPYYAGTYTPAPDATGHQVMAQLGAGGLAVNSSSTPFSCSGGGIHQTSGSSWEVPVVAGQTAQVVCTL